MEKGGREAGGQFLQLRKVTKRWFPNFGILPRQTHLRSILCLPLGTPGLPALPSITHSTLHPLSQPLERRSLAPGLPPSFLFVIVPSCDLLGQRSRLILKPQRWACILCSPLPPPLHGEFPFSSSAPGSASPGLILLGETWMEIVGDVGVYTSWP